MLGLLIGGLKNSLRQKGNGAIIIKCGILEKEMFPRLAVIPIDFRKERVSNRN